MCSHVFPRPVRECRTRVPRSLRLSTEEGTVEARDSHHARAWASAVT
jgi:hypothetical protein